MTSLFSPLTLGNIELQNRIIMAPLTRSRAGESRIPNALMAEYYAQRASAGLIIAEATAISPQGYGWPGAPGVYTDEHEAGWKLVTQAIHNKGGKIVLQLWHMGRVKDESLYEEGEKAVAPSAIAAVNNIRRSSGKPYPKPRALETDELLGIIENYVQAAKRAIRAGFDGVEVHAANGYLLDQFIRDGSNKRTDKYGGSIENRLRFPLEVTHAIVKAIGAEKTGLRISPTNPFNDMEDSNPISTFTTLTKELNVLNLAYLHILEAQNPAHPLYAEGQPFVTPEIRKIYKGNLIINGGFDKESGEEAIREDKTEAIAYGVPFIANPDLVKRFKNNIPLNAPDQNTFYTNGAKGYTDYPFATDRTA